MKIIEDRSYVNLDAYARNIADRDTENATNKTQVKSQSRSDTVELSETAQRILDARNKINSIPDVREDKIALIRNRIENGLYSIDSKKISTKMLEETLLNEKI